MTDASYRRIRATHIASSLLIAIGSVIHSASTWFYSPVWTPESVWFLGTGLGLLLVAALNLSHIGIEPCRMPTTRLVRITNWIYFAYAVAACVAIPQPHALLLTIALLVQAIMSLGTLPGPSVRHDQEMP
jgi:hypothetical protein